MNVADVAPVEHFAASVDITPLQPCALGGFGGSPRVWNRVEDPLEANAIAFDDGRRLVCLISLDTLYVGAELSDWMDRLVAMRWPHREVMVVTFASHTHFAPMLDRSKPILGPVDEEYLSFLKTKLENLVNRLASAPVQGGWRRSLDGEARVSVNRRYSSKQRTWNNRFMPARQVFMAPNPDGYVDQRLRIQMITDLPGAAQAAIVHFACHPTSYPDSRAVTSDYIGSIRDAVRTEAGRKIPVLFIQGCAGDVRASVQGSISPISLLRTIKSGPHFRTPSLRRWQAWREQVICAARTALAQPGETHALCGPIFAVRTHVSPSELFDGTPKGPSLEISHIGVAGLRIVAANAELLAGWSSSVPSDVFLGGYSGDCFGYLPMQEDVLAGGYEVDGYPALVLRTALRWKTGFEEAVAHTMTRLLPPGAGKI